MPSSMSFLFLMSVFSDRDARSKLFAFNKRRCRTRSFIYSLTLDRASESSPKSGSVYERTTKLTGLGQALPIIQPC
jgi:hypothetical protein